MGQRSLLEDVCRVLIDWLREPAPADPGLDKTGWQALVTAIRVHGLGARLSQRLDGVDWLPADVETWIAEEAHLNSLRIRRLCNEGLTILSMAADRGVQVLPLKGLALAAYLPSSDLRPMADIDLLVRPDQSAALGELLSELGYELAVSKAKHDEYLPSDRRRVASNEHEHPDNPRPVEVHTQCGESFARTRVELTDLTWASACPREITGQRARVPGVEALWCHLAVHAGWQWWFGGGRIIQLLDLIDLLPMVRRPEAALASVDARFALLSLGPAARLFPGSVPTRLIRALEQEAGRSAARLAAELDPVRSSHLISGGRSRLLRMLRLLRDRPAALARAAGYVLAPTIDEMLINHDRAPQGRLRHLAYPALWLWHLVNLIGRA